jgi:hypothetical protein
VRMLSIQWGESAPTALVSSIKVPPGFSNGDSGSACPKASGWAKLEQQELGERKKHGVVVQGCRTIGTTGGTRSITVVIETWQSPVLRIQLLSTEQDSDGNESRMEVTQLRIGEPDLSKFLPPEHYKVVTAR